LQDVGVGLGIATKYSPKERHASAQVAKVKRAPCAPLRSAEVQHEQSSAGPGHAPHLSQAASPTGQVAQTVAHGDDLKRTVGKWNLLGIASQEMQAPDGAWRGSGRSIGA